MRPHVLVVDDDAEARAWIVDTLALAGYKTTCVGSGREAVARLADQTDRPNLVVLDLEMPDGDGLSVLASASGHADAATVPAIVLSGHSDIAHRVAALDAGAVDFVPKPVDGRELLARVRAHLRVSSLASQWRDGADLDPLTGVLNRRAFIDRLAAQVEQVARTNSALAVMFIDLDNFKEVNDRYGHTAGDRMLRRFTRVLAHVLAGTELIGRWGGDEFVVAFPAADRDHVERVAGELQFSLSAHLGHSRVGASVGVAWLLPHDLPHGATDCIPLSLIEAADRAMYDNKASRSGVHRLPATH